MVKKTISIEGMHCASCAGNVEKSLKSVNGVKSAKASLLFKKAEIEAEDNVNVEEVKRAVSKLGYKVKEIK
jgi:copper chaperone CopZ